MIGFTFRGKHSYNDFGIIMRSVDRPILPEKRKRQTEIPLRHGQYNFDGATYDVRPNQLQCFIDRATIADLRSHVRKIAAWLSKEGELVFDDEPDKRYTARIFTAISLEQILTAGIFSLFFECDPFAMGQYVEQQVTITQSGQNVYMPYSGTQATGCRLTLTNVGTSAVAGIRLLVNRE